MKKISCLIAAALMLSSAFFITAGFSSCEDDSTNVDDQSNGNTDEYTIKSYTIDLTMSTTSASTLNAFCAKTGTTVSTTDASRDIMFGWNSGYGYCFTSPNSTWLTEAYGANSVSYSAISRATKFKNLGSVSISQYNTVSALPAQTISSSDYDPSGKFYGCKDVLQGDVIMFETCDGLKGVMQVGSLSKVTKKMNATLYVAIPNNSSY